MADARMAKAVPYLGYVLISGQKPGPARAEAVR
jgi:hypothetical protein